MLYSVARRDHAYGGCGGLLLGVLLRLKVLGQGEGDQNADEEDGDQQFYEREAVNWFVYFRVVRRFVRREVYSFRS